MKLCRIRTDDGIKPAAVDSAGAFRDLSAIVLDIDSAQITPEAITALGSVDLATCPVIFGRLAPFLRDVGRIFCIGLNYYDHAAEMGLDVPEHPILFMKACAASGATDPIILPKGSTKTDWEVELGVIIGTTAKHVSEETALDHVAGYCVANDVSERSFQMDFGGQWVKGKSADSFAPLGPYLATRDEIADTLNLALSLKVNGATMQNGSTKTMVFSVPQIVAHISRFLTLHPGDIILTGTPPGVGGGMKPQKFLKAGDVVEAEIEGLGVIRQDVSAD
ncbi:fumarylacetoacetate hydrolase family protein [Cognatiyoonia sp. IB215446]|uniref:fumarylacetoacetate hydrolase family protein n=1 Tax=Cognatiyoonia sp. IB215446 TaxID=3097355 RepID=UPI002A13F2A0|nr:fumarylacetoacetate hydrolase family protein [Cognatiyoonia sp. IB215446]MDX8347827.1 fumarylacetoacetate hydrolase family protein [Cognatiyoonia sp. IB215446]